MIKKLLDSPWLLFVCTIAAPLGAYGVLGWFAR